MLPAETVKVPLDVSPDVAVIRPEIVGVAVQAVGFTVRVVPALPKLVLVELVIPRFKAATESSTKLPLVAVEIVRVPAVFVHELVPPELMTRAPVVLPMLTVLPAIAAKVALPLTLIPPAPCI